jgi:hypothetical protein
MANFYSDSHGERWGVMMQEKSVSCGLACAAMAEVYIKSQIQASMEAIFREISQKFPGNFKEDRGASMDNIVDVLRSRGIHCYDNHDYGLVEFAGSQLPAYTATDNTGIYGGAVVARGTLTGPMIITRPNN